MASVKILLVLSIILCLEVSVNNGIGVPPQPPQDITSSPGNLTSHEPTTSHSPTTKPTSSQPTSKPTTSSTTPTTTTTGTTAKPTTTSSNPPPKTTTPTPTPTTPSTTTKPTSPAPTPSPTPVPDPSVGKWSLNFTKSNDSCLLIDAALQIEIPRVNSTSLKINVPINATAMGTCSNVSDGLALVWEKTNIIAMNFVKNETSKKFELEIVTAILNVTLQNGTSQFFNITHKKPEFSTSLGHSYKCAKVQTLNFTTEGSNDTIAMLHISHAQLQAFSNVTDHKFYDAIDCEASAITSDVVPIVVGCVLAILVVVVLVAYLVGRRYCQARGYHSM